MPKPWGDDTDLVLPITVPSLNIVEITIPASGLDANDVMFLQTAIENMADAIIARHAKGQCDA